MWIYRPSKPYLFLLFFTFLFLGYGITEIGLWHDEGYTVLISELPFSEFIYFLKTYETNPPFFYLISKVFLFLFSGNVWSIRIPSLLASLATSYLVYLWMRNTLNERAGIFAAVLYGFSSITLFYAQEGRTYALLGGVYCGLLICHHIFEKTPSKTCLFLLALSNIFLLYLHNYSLILWGSVLLFYGIYFFQKDKKNLFKPWLFAQGIVFIFYLPWLRIYWHHLNLLKDNAFLAGIAGETTFFQLTLGSLRNLMPGDFYPQSIMVLPHIPWGWVVSSLLFLVILWQRPWRNRRVFITLLYFSFFPLLVLILYSCIFSPVFILGRTEAIVLPVFCALLGFSFRGISSKHFRRLVLSVVVFCGLFSFIHYHFLPTYPQKKWDQISANRLFQDHNPKLILVGYDVQATIPVYLSRNLSNPIVLIYPDEKKIGKNRETRRFPVLHKRKLTSEEIIQKANAHLDEYLKNHNVKEIGIIFYTPGKKEGNWVYPKYMRDLIFRLSKNWGYQSEHIPYVYPMDWSSGYHVIRVFQKRN